MPNEFFLPPGYEDLADDCKRFQADHPDYGRNVFIMTRFVPGNRLLARLDETLRQTLCRHGLKGLRADDRVYPNGRELWRNVCVYMLCCKYGVAVLEDRIADEFNPNVALEYGFMRALAKPVLLLADSGFRSLRADIVGTLREEFDLTDIDTTLPPALERWIRDLGIDPVVATSLLSEQAAKILHRLRKIECAGLILDTARRTKERNDEFWYLGEEIAAYRALLDSRPGNEAHCTAVEVAHRRLVHGHDLAALAEAIRSFTALTQDPGA